MSVLLLTKNDCPQCNQLKMFLKFGLNGKYDSDIEVVNKELNQERFDELTKQYNVLTLPTFIMGDEVLSKTQPTNVVEFLEKHIGKKQM